MVRKLFTDYDEVQGILTRWQHKEGRLNTSEQRTLHHFITSVSNDRWNRHFKNKHRDWVSTVEMRLQVPMVLMDYMLTRKSVRVKGANGYYCEVDNPQYKTLGLILYEFRIQFPRIVSTLTAWSTGITINSEVVNWYQLIQTTEHNELHKSLIAIRQVAKERGVELYTTHRYELLNEVWTRLYNKPSLPLLNQYIQSTRYRRRAYILYAAADILAYRVKVNDDMYNKGYGYGRHNLLRDLHHDNTNYDD